MGRPSKPPRLQLRGMSWYIVDDGRKIACNTRDAAEAQQALAQYVAGKSAQTAVARESAMAETVDGMLDYYEAYRLDKLRLKVNARAYRQAYREAVKAGTDPAQAHVEAERAANAAQLEIDDVGSDRYTLRILRCHLGKLLPSQLCQAVIDDYARTRRATGVSRRSTGEIVKRIADSTIERELNLLISAIRLAWEKDSERWFPGGKPNFKKPLYVADQGRIRFLTKTEAAKLIAACHLPHIRLLFRIMLATGARRGAVEELRWDQVRFDHNYIDFGEVDPDNRKKRPLIQMAPELRRELWNAHQVACSPWVVEFRGRKAGNTKKSVKAAILAAGLGAASDDEDTVGHTMKHTFVTWMLAAGKGWEEISLVVNTSVSTLRRTYGHLDRAYIASVAEAVALDEHIQKLNWEPIVMADAAELSRRAAE